MSIFNALMYSSAFYFGAKYFNVNIDGFLMKQAYNFMFLISCAQIAAKNSEIVKFVRDRYKCLTKKFVNTVEIVKYNEVIYTTKPDHHHILIYSFTALKMKRRKK